MAPIVKNILAVVAGVVVGSIVNMALVTVGPMIIPLPEGADVSDMSKLAESLKLFKPVNFLPPFLGHAIGTLAGATLTAWLASSRKMTLALVIGAWFLLGGITAAAMFGGPLWFIVLDLVVAYIPMGYLGGILGGRSKSK